MKVFQQNTFVQGRISPSVHKEEVKYTNYWRNNVNVELTEAAKQQTSRWNTDPAFHYPEFHTDKYDRRRFSLSQCKVSEMQYPKNIRCHTTSFCSMKASVLFWLWGPTILCSGLHIRYFRASHTWIKLRDRKHLTERHSWQMTAHVSISRSDRLQEQEGQSSSWLSWRSFLQYVLKVKRNSLRFAARSSSEDADWFSGRSHSLNLPHNTSAVCFLTITR